MFESGFDLAKRLRRNSSGYHYFLKKIPYFRDK